MFSGDVASRVCRSGCQLSAPPSPRLTGHRGQSRPEGPQRGGRVRVGRRRCGVVAPGGRAPVSCDSRGLRDSPPTPVSPGTSRVTLSADGSQPLPWLTVACVLSTPAPLGPLRKVRLWHDGRGASAAWYVSHVMVQALRAGPGLGRGWFFPAECWLAAGRRDGRVERELACLRGGPRLPEGRRHPAPTWAATGRTQSPALPVPGSPSSRVRGAAPVPPGCCWSRPVSPGPCHPARVTWPISVTVSVSGAWGTSPSVGWTPGPQQAAWHPPQGPPGSQGAHRPGKFSCAGQRAEGAGCRGHWGPRAEARRPARRGCVSGGSRAAAPTFRRLWASR